jgi:hypothetical protein
VPDDRIERRRLRVDDAAGKQDEKYQALHKNPRYITPAAHG